MKQLILCIVSLLSTQLISAQTDCSSMRYRDTIFHDVSVTTNVYFGTATPYGVLAQPQDLYMDIYAPAGDTLAKRPLIVFQFGGGFVIGWRTEPDIPAFCTYFAKCGYVVATIDYRIGLNVADTNSTVRAFYRGWQDERSALRYLCQRANQYKLDTSSIFLTGTSAGCFCGLANAYMTNADRPVSSFGSTLEPDDLGCIDCSGNTDFGHHIPHIRGVINQWGAVLDTNYIEAAENVPVISFHGDQDVLVPYVYGYPFQLPVFPPVYGSVPIHQRLNNLGILNEFHPFVGFGHEPELLAPQLNDTIYNYSRPFLYQILKPQTSAMAGPNVICKNDVATYSVINTTGSKYCWQVTGNAQIIANTGSTIKVLYTDSGNVTVSVTELNYLQAEGDMQSFSTYVTERPHANFAYLQNDLELTLVNWSSNATSYLWLFGDGTTATTNAPVKNYTTGGTYTITLIADNNACTDTFKTTLGIDSCPVANFTYQLTNRNGFFYANATNTTQYFWNFGDGDSAATNNSNVIHPYAADGTYQITLRVRNQFGCIATDTQTITIITTGINDIAKEESIACDNSGCNIHSGNTTMGTLYVLNSTGQLIAQHQVIGNFYLNTSTYPAGLYFIWLETNNGVWLNKFVKN